MKQTVVARYNYRAQFGEAFQELFEKIGNMLLEGDYVLTAEVDQFEEEYATFLGRKFAIGVNSGTDALILSLLATGVGRGDEVITAANTFYATVAAICFVGATPVLVDPNESDYLINIDALKALVSPRTRAVIPVHLFGKAMDLQALRSWCDERGIWLIEDAAQAHGATISGKTAGTQGHISCFSFHPSKNLAAAGDAGAITLDDEKLSQRLRILRMLGQERQNEHVAIGLNSKLDAIQAAVLRWKLPYLEAWNKSRKNIAYRYRLCLQDMPVTFQDSEFDKGHVYHLFQVRTSQRDSLLNHLQARGIDATIRYPTPIHLQPAFQSFGWKKGDYPTAEILANECLCLPIRPDMTEEEIGCVVNGVRTFYGA